MSEMKACCKVPFPERLSEGYEVHENALYANVNAAKVPAMMKRFIELHRSTGEEGVQEFRRVSTLRYFFMERARTTA